jgi:hypothetical protein
MPRKEKFIDGETVSFDDEPTEVRRRDDAAQDAPTLAQNIPAELISATLPVSEADPNDPLLRDTVADPPPDHAEASGEVDTAPPDEDSEPGERDVDLSVRLAEDLDMESIGETITEVAAKPADDLVIVFRDESVPEDGSDDEFDGLETVERVPAKVEPQTARGKKHPAEEVGQVTETRAGHRRARTRQGDSVAGPLPLAPGLDDERAIENRTTQRHRTRKKRRREPSESPSAGEDEITKVRGE